MNPSGEPFSIRLGVVLLAAGASSRMGRPKLLLPWGRTSVLGHLLTQWRQLGTEQIAVVCARNNEAMHRALDDLGFPIADRLINPFPESGMFSSIQCAACWDGWRGSVTHWAVSLGDQPAVTLETLRALLAFAHNHADQVCQPSRGGRARHPVLLPAAEFVQLATASEPHFKQFLQNRRSRVALCELDDPGLDLDLDEPADYELARQFATPALAPA